jgi:hypothetical protein
LWLSKPQGNVRLLNRVEMKAFDRDLLVLLKNEFMSQQAIEQEVEYLHEILLKTEGDEEFCRANELVHRNHITQNPHKLLKAFRQASLKPFWFFISKN